MLLKLALLFIGIPLIELALLVQIGGLIGFWPTMGIVVLTGAAGAMLAKLAGVHVVMQIRREILSGRMPVGHMLDGLLVLVGGVVLLTPGLLTDVFGFALLIPWSRRRIRDALRRRVQRMVEAKRIDVLTIDGRDVGGREVGGREG